MFSKNAILATVVAIVGLLTLSGVVPPSVFFALVVFIGIPKCIHLIANKIGDSTNNSGELFTPQQQAMIDAIADKKKIDPLVGLKIGGGEVLQGIIKVLKDEKGVHVESLLGVLGSLAGYSCHAALREELIDSGKKKENEVFTIVGDTNGKKYYFGDMPNQPLVEGRLSIWSLVAGVAQSMGVTDLPDINSTFSHVAKTVGTHEFGMPCVSEQYMPGDLPVNYVKTMWTTSLPIIDRFCERPMERPILLGLAIQKAIEMSKGVMPTAEAVKLVMECALPMSKIGPEWMEQ